MKKSLILLTFLVFVYSVDANLTPKQIQNSRWKGIYNSLLQSICGKKRQCSKQEQAFVMQKFNALQAQIVQSNMKPYKIQGQIYMTAEQIAAYGIQKAQALLNNRLDKLKRFQGKKTAFLNKVKK